MNSSQGGKERIDKLDFRPNSRADMATDIRDTIDIVIKLNEVIDFLNQQQ